MCLAVDGARKDEGVSICVNRHVSVVRDQRIGDANGGDTIPGNYDRAPVDHGIGQDDPAADNAIDLLGLWHRERTSSSNCLLSSQSMGTARL